MTLLLDIRKGATLPQPIYKHKPYVVLNSDDVILSAGSLEEIKALPDYYDDCAVEIRRHDLHLTDNTKIGIGDVLHKAGSTIRITKIKSVFYEPIRKRVGSVRVAGLGNIPTLENTGKVDKSRLVVNTGHLISVPASKAEVHKRYRKLRPEESRRINDIDRRINELRLEREALLREAWDKGHVVTVKELVELAEASK